MGLFHFVEQHDAIRLASDRLGQHAAFAVTHIARRRAFQSRNRVALLVLRHIDDHHVALAAKQRVGEGQSGFRLAHAARTDQHEYADRTPRVFQFSARSADPLSDGLERMRLSNNALL